MADPSDSDRSLLDRLNALKPTSVTLDPSSSNALNVSAKGIQPAEPLSREDALSKRLQTLRNRRDESAAGSGDPPPPYTETPKGSPSQSKTQPPPSASLSSQRGSQQQINPVSLSQGDRDDPVLGDEDRTLDEILEGLDVGDDQWSISEDGGGDEDSKRVEELLAKLKEDPEAQPPPPIGNKSSDPGKGAKDGDENEDDDDDDDDDSEGEDMSREVENVISQAMDDLNLDDPTTRPAQPDEPSEPPDPGTDTGSGEAKDNTGDSGTKPEDHPGGDHDPALPLGPQDTLITHINKDEPSTTALPISPEGEGGTDNDTAGLSLPTVPTALVDPAPPPTTNTDPFESSIAARLVALKGPSHAPITTDSFGLPSAPTFQPEDRPVAGVVKKVGYSDEDQKTWCIVCLEDAAVRCLGCDGDVYCARCWKDMHVGPTAGYDERGHRWERFERR